MSAPCPVRHWTAASIVLAALLGSSAFANTLPPGPVMGHPAEYVIVTPGAFAGPFHALARWKTRSGIPTTVRTLESILSNYPGGRDAAESVRMFLQDAHAQWGTRWVLLGGLPPLVPARRVPATVARGQEVDLVTDLYFGALQGDWDADGDGIFGEPYRSADDPGDAVDLHQDVWVGRAPVRTVAEARDFVTKVMQTPTDPQAPSRMLLGAVVIFPYPWVPGSPVVVDFAPDAEQIAAEVAGLSGVEIQRLYQNYTDPRWPDASELTRASLLGALRAGADFLVTENWGDQLAMNSGRDSVTAADLASLTDAARPTQAWITASSSGNFEGDCLAAAFVRGATGGAATCVAPSAPMYFGPNQISLKDYVAALYPPNMTSVGEALARSKSSPTLVNNSATDSPIRLLLMELNLLGDPEAHLRMPVTTPLQVSFPAEVGAGPRGFDVEVEADGAVPGARVCAMLGDRALAIATTDASGRAHLEFPEGSAGNADLTVTAPDGARFEGSLAVGAVTAVAPGVTAGFRFDLPQPNPAFGAARFAGVSEAPAALDLFDVGGRRVRSFAIAPGAFALRWDLRDTAGRPVAPGLYLARLVSPQGVTTRRLLVGR